MRPAQARIGLRGVALGLGLLGGFAGATRGSGGAQQSKAAPAPTAPAGATILNGAFASNLADPELNWPTAEGVGAPEARDADYARYDASRWQSIVLAAPFRAVPYGGRSMRDEGSEFTAGVSAGGYDGIYYCWETERYRFQFRCAQWMMSVMVEPKWSPTRVKLSPEEVERRTAGAVAEIVNRGEQLLANSSMVLEPTPYGYRVKFRQTPEQSDRFDRGAQMKNVSPDWLRFLSVRTDGYSYVLDFPKYGVGSTLPSMPVTTTQPGAKNWFELTKRKPAAPAPRPKP